MHHCATPYACSGTGLSAVVRLLLLTLLLSWHPASAAEPSSPTPSSPTPQPSLVVVELFTSQGCSSCPPADALIGELGQRADILALSQHVEYWDYLGWKDPFASPLYSTRQREYAKALGLKYVYTPQIVIQGRVQLPGNEREAVLQAVADQGRPKEALLSIRFAAPGQLVVDVAGKENARPADIWLVQYDRTQITPIDRGENRGRELANYNVVRDLRRIGRWQGEPMQIAVDLGQEGAATIGCAILLQAESAGPVLDAVRCAPRHG